MVRPSASSLFVMLCLIGVGLSPRAAEAQCTRFTVTKLANSGCGVVSLDSCFVAAPGLAPDVKVTSTGQATILIRAMDPNARINAFLIEAEGPCGSGNNEVRLRFESAPGTNGSFAFIGFIGQFEDDTPPNNNPNRQVIIDALDIALPTDGGIGGLGGCPNYPGLAVLVQRVNACEIAGDILGEVRGSLSIGTRINCRNLLGNVITPSFGTLAGVLASGEIGSESLSIRPKIEVTGANGIIPLVQGKSIYAEVVTPTDTLSTAGVERINATGSAVLGEGFLRGTVTTRSLGTAITDPTPCLKINGAFAGQVSLSGTVKNRIELGSVAATGVISIGTTGGPVSDLIDSGDITVQGAMAGRIEIEGDKIGSMTVTTGGLTGTVRVRGDLEAASTHTIAGGIVSGGRLEVGGDLSGAVAVTGSPMSGTITVGRHFAGSISMPAGGLEGQVIINADNASGTWTGNVTMGSSAITHASNGEYSVVSDTLGGGAVGLVPFRLYATDCEPQNNLLTVGPTTVVTTDFNENDDNIVMPIKIRFYGPVTHGEGNSWDDATVIECKPLIYGTNPCSTGVNWVDVSQGFLVRGPDDDGWDLGDRTIGLSRATDDTFIGPGIYRIRFSGVFCADISVDDRLVAATTPCSGGAAYYFRVGANCNNNEYDDDDPADMEDGQCNGGCGDFNHDSMVAVDDIFDFLTAWFAGCNGTQPITTCPYGTADFNGTGGVTVADIFAFLTAWFQGQSSCN